MIRSRLYRFTAFPDGTLPRGRWILALAPFSKSVTVFLRRAAGCERNQGVPWLTVEREPLWQLGEFEKKCRFLP